LHFLLSFFTRPHEYQIAFDNIITVNALSSNRFSSLNFFLSFCSTLAATQQRPSITAFSSLSTKPAFSVHPIRIITHQINHFVAVSISFPFFPRLLLEALSMFS